MQSLGNPNLRGFLQGMLLAVIIFGISIPISQHIEPNSTPVSAAFNWDYTSTQSFSVQLTQRLQNIVFLEVLVGRVSDTNNQTNSFSFSPFPILGDNVHRIKFVEIPVDINPTQEFVDLIPHNWQETNQYLRVYDCCFTMGPPFIEFDVTGLMTAESLTSKMIEDLNNIPSISNVTKDRLSIISEIQSLNSFIFWEVDYIFDEGSRISIFDYNSTVIIEEARNTRIEFRDGREILHSDLEFQRQTFQGFQPGVQFPEFLEFTRNLIGELIDD